MATGFSCGYGLRHERLSPTLFLHRWPFSDGRAVRSTETRNKYLEKIKDHVCVVSPHDAGLFPDDQGMAQTAHINELPEEILLSIFKLLDLVDLARSVIPVCSRWNRLGRDESLWSGETLRYNPILESPGGFIDALSAAPVLGAVEYISNDGVTLQDIADALAKGCPRVLSLTILRWYLDSSLLRNILDHLADHIQHLEVFIPDLTMLIPIGYMHNLQTLILHGEISYLSDLLLKLGTGCRRLTTLDLSGLRFNDVFCLNVLMESVIKGHSDSLTSLKLPPNLSGTRVLDAVALCTKLKVLAIWITPSITTAALTGALTNLKLESLTWRNYDGWLNSLELVQFILSSHHFTNLQEFCLIDCIDMCDGMALAIAHRSQNLQRLSLHRCELSARGLHEILTRAHQLVSLDVYKNSSFDVEHLKIISVQLTELRYLDIRGCHNIRTLSHQIWGSILLDLPDVNIRWD